MRGAIWGLIFGLLAWSVLGLLVLVLGCAKPVVREPDLLIDTNICGWLMPSGEIVLARCDFYEAPARAGRP